MDNNIFEALTSSAFLKNKKNILEATEGKSYHSQLKKIFEGTDPEKIRQDVQSLLNAKNDKGSVVQTPADRQVLQNFVDDPTKELAQQVVQLLTSGNVRKDSGTKHLVDTIAAEAKDMDNPAANAQAPDINKIKELVKDNPDITDWPDDQLKLLVAFLNSQKEFTSSKKAQAALKAIQQAEAENGSEGGENNKKAAKNPAQDTTAQESPTESTEVKGNASKVVPAAMNRVQNALTQNGFGQLFNLDDLIAAIKANPALSKLIK